MYRVNVIPRKYSSYAFRFSFKILFFVVYMVAFSTMNKYSPDSNDFEIFIFKKKKILDNLILFNNSKKKL